MTRLWPPWETTGPKIIMQSTYHRVYGPEAPFVLSGLLPGSLPKKPEYCFLRCTCNWLQMFRPFPISARLPVSMSIPVTILSRKVSPAKFPPFAHAAIAAPGGNAGQRQNCGWQ